MSVGSNSPGKRKAPPKLDQVKLLDYAVKTLGVRAYSTGEMRTRLRRRADSAATVDHVMAKLREYGYLNDEKFAEGFATSRAEGHGFGKQRVIRDLRSRQVGQQAAEKAAEAAFAGKDENEMAAAFLQRKYRGKVLPEWLKEPKNLAAAFRRLRYAGFSSGASIKTLKRYSEMAEQLEED